MGQRAPTRSDRPQGEPAAAYLDSLAPDEIVGMLDRISDGIVVLGEDWRYRYLNDPAAAMLGRSRQELLGRHIWTEFPEGVGQPFHLAYEEAMRERKPMRINQYYAPFGRWFENRIFPQDDNLLILFQETTAMQRVEAELREYADRMTEAERIAHLGVWKWDLGSGQVRWSDELHRIYGLREGEFEGTVEGFLSYLHPDDRDRVWSHVEAALEAREPFDFEERIVRPSGEVRLLRSQGRPIAGRDGSVEALVGVCHDITERAEAERALVISERRVRTIIDKLPSIVTVKNLDGQYELANSEFADLLAMPALDVIGTECGALFPAEIADRFRLNDQRAVESGEAVYDEVILPRDDERRTFSTVTFALPDEQGRPSETCTIATDVTDRPERESERRERLEWERVIGAALAEDRMVVFAQPVIDLASGERMSCELLVRMRQPEGSDELLQPGDFLPAAERFGLIQAIDAWMVAEALRTDPGLAVEVNLSAVTLCDPEARREIVGLLAAQPEKASEIVFEITETVAAEYIDAVCEFADELTGLGCGLALDDFGTGFGSFTYLRRLPLRYIKIDRSFVRDLVGSRDDQRVVNSIIGIAEQFDLHSIVEGVEDEPTLELLRELGAHYVQGFHLGRPAPLSDYSEPTARPTS